MQYAKTSDGLNIAFCALGKGPALLQVPALTVPTHIQLEWRIQAARTWYERLSLKHRLILYDIRGCGSSQRDVMDYSLDATVRDIEAVTERLALDRFALYGFYLGAATAIACATHHPDRVSHLIAWHGWPRFPDASGLRPAPSSYLTLIRDDWELFTEVYAHEGFGWPEGEVARSYAALTRQAITPETLLRQFVASRQLDATEEALRSGDWTVYTETLARLWLGFENREFTDKLAAYIRECVEPEALRAAGSSSENQDWDVSALLPRVSAHTLVVHNRNNRFLRVQIGQRLAARIPNARFQVIDDMNYEQLPGIITGFLGESDQIAQTQVDVPSGTAVILFADIADSTPLTERLGDAAFRAKARDLDSALRTVIREHAGTPIEGKLLGDGVLAVFSSARQAIEAALVSGKAGDDCGLLLHLGLHAGDVIREDNNVYGGAVNIAARISGLSAPGEVLVSKTVRSLARTSAGVLFDDRGEQALKGVGEAVRVWAVVEGGE